MPKRAIRVIASRLLFFPLVLASFVPLASSQPNWSVAKKMHLGGPGAWDYVTFDSDNHRLYVPRTADTMVIDADSGKVIADIPGQKRAHGVALVPKAGRGFISDGGGEGGFWSLI